MTTLTRWADTDTAGSVDSATLRTSSPDEIAAELSRVGIRYEQWPVRDVPAGSDAAAVLDVYRDEVDRLVGEQGFKVIDVARLQPPPEPDEEWTAAAAGARAKFLAEHTHAEDEVRFFIEGSGIFYLHVDDSVIAVQCEQGDLLSVPALTRHWFDMGTSPSFAAIRFFLDPEGWVGTFTGDDIATHFADFDTLAAAGAA
jgi:1,2-dihydroxy-3-keto-5-methylthiopentene dioxygenase